MPRVDITRERFEELVGEALDGLPAWVLETMDNVTVQVEDLPPPGQPGLLGLYRGIPLSQREFTLLNYLINRRGTVCTRQELLADVWGLAFDPGTNVVDVYVRRLRNKLTADSIETVRNVGYRLLAG